MISKCENIVINRTKFSEFEIYDPAIEDVNNLNIVGYVDDSGVKKNVAISYNQIINALSSANDAGPGIFLTAADLFNPSNKDAYFGEIPCGDGKHALFIANSDVNLIQIHGITRECGLNDNTLLINFVDTNNKFAFGKELILVLSGLDNKVNIKDIYNGIGDDGTINVIIKYAKVSEASSVHSAKMTPVSIYIGRDGVYYPYSAYTASGTALHDDFISFTGASIEYVNNSIAEEGERIEDIISEESALITKEYTAADEILSNRITEVAESLGASQSDLSKILHVKKFASLNHLLEASEAMSVTELSRLIALVNQGTTEEGPYAEYICVNPDKESETKVFHILGDSDTVYADDITIGTHGSVVLVSNINEESVTNPLYGTESAVTGQYIAGKGYALSPVALIDLYKKHKETQETITSIEDDLNQKVDNLTSDLDVIFKELEIDDKEAETVQSRLDDIENKLDAATTSSSEELEYIKKVIGLNGCHDSCSYEGCDCSDLDGKCSILCRISENERDIDIVNNQSAQNTTDIAEIKSNVEVLNSESVRISDLITSIAANEDAINTEINEELERIKEVIGLNGCHDNCSCESENCSDLEGKCSILCRVDENERDIDIINNQSAQNTTDIVKIKGDIKALNEETVRISDLITSITTAEDAINTELRELINANTALIGTTASDINEDITELVNTNTGIKNSITTIESKVNTNETNIGDITTRLGLVETKASENSTVISNFNTTVTELTTKINTNTNNIGTINGAINELQSKNSEIINNLTNLTNTSNGHATSITELTESLASINLRQDAQDTLNAGFRTDIDAINERNKVTQPNFNITLDCGILESGEKTFEIHDICEKLDVESANYNFNVAEVRIADEDGWVNVYPSVKYQGDIDELNADYRSVTVTTGITDKRTIIILSIYIKDNFVFEI